MSEVKNGKCPHCPYRWRLRTDGTLMRHHLYGINGKFRCEGSHQKPRPETRK